MTTKKTTTRRTTKKAEVAPEKEEIVVTEQVDDPDMVEVAPVAEEPTPEPVVEEVVPEPVAEPELKAKVKAIKTQEAARTDLSSLYRARGFVDFSGTAGPADHDLRRAYGAFDIETVEDATEEIPAHLRKYVDSPDGAINLIKEGE